MDWKKVKSGALSSLDTAIQIAERIPDVSEDKNSDFSYEKSANPFPLLIDLIRRFRGYDAIIKYTARFIAWVLPAVEVAAKAALIANLKNLLYCTIDPLLRKNDVLRDGIVISIEDIDLMHTLQYCPIKANSILGAKPNERGHLYYFGCDGFEFPSELVNAGDFNAFLWYIMNRTSRRVVWRGTSQTRNLAQSAEMFGINNADSYIYQKKLAARPTEDTPDTKDNGIITLIHYADGETPRDASGLPWSKPKLIAHASNLIHVYIGNTTSIGYDDTNFALLEDRYQSQCNTVATLEKNLDGYKKQIAKTEQTIEKLKNLDSVEEHKATIERLKKDVEKTEKRIKEEKNKTQTLAKEYLKQKKLQVEPYGESDYRPIKTNCYYNKTLMEFNYDYIMSIKLFDSKVVAAQLIDNILNMSSSGNIQISYERKVIEEEIKKTISGILERGTVTINDCFFAFSNEELNDLQRKAELQRAGLYSANGEDNTTSVIDVDSILANLNNISPNATQEEVQTVIEGTFTEISKEIAGGTERSVEDHMDGNVGWNFTKQLMENLLTVIVETICSPKVYLVYLINLQLLGKFDKNFNLEKFLKAKGELIAALVQKIADIWADFLLGIFRELSADILKMVKDILVGEQFEYYKKLVRQCIECFKMAKDNNYLDFNLEDVDYADILSDQENATEDNC